MKIYRYTVVVDGNIRILSIGLNRKKIKLENDTDRFDYKFSHAITNVGDQFNIKNEAYILTGRIGHDKYSEFDFDIIMTMDNRTTTKGFVQAYRQHVIRTVISKLRDVKGKEIKIEDYNINPVSS